MDGKYYLLLHIISAPITPGTHAQSVRRKTITIDPQPLSITAKGGKMIQRITRQIDIVLFLLIRRWKNYLVTKLRDNLNTDIKKRKSENLCLE